MAGSETGGAVSCLLATAVKQPHVEPARLLCLSSFLRFFLFSFFSKWSPYGNVSHSSESGVT